MADLLPEKVIVLDPPVDFHGVPYAKLTLREPKAGELVDCDALQGYAFTAALTAKVAGVPPEVVREIPARDLNEAGDYLLGFVKASRTTPTGS